MTNAHARNLFSYSPNPFGRFPRDVFVRARVIIICYIFYVYLLLAEGTIADAHCSAPDDNIIQQCLPHSRDSCRTVYYVRLSSAVEARGFEKKIR